MKGKRKAMLWDPLQSAAEAVRLELPAAAKRFFKAGRKASGSGISAGRLHGFRLETKRFRYTLELFRPIYGPGLEGRLAALRRVQQFLGDISDYAAMRELIAAGRRRQTPQLRRLLARIDAEEERRTQEFLAYWRESFDPPAAEQRWIRYLAKRR